MDATTILGSSQGGGPGLFPHRLPALWNTLLWDIRNLSVSVRECVCKKDIKVHNNAIKCSLSIPESIEPTHHISISDHEWALVHIVLTAVYDTKEHFYLKHFTKIVVCPFSGWIVHFQLSVVSCHNIKTINTEAIFRICWHWQNRGLYL